MPADRTEQVVEAMARVSAERNACDWGVDAPRWPTWAKGVRLDMKALLEALPPDLLAVLRGEMVAVPVEPTQEMLKAASDAFLDAVASHKSGDSTVTPFRGWWAAMLAARPVKP